MIVLGVFQHLPIFSTLHFQARRSSSASADSIIITQALLASNKYESLKLFKNLTANAITQLTEESIYSYGSFSPV